MPGPVRQQPYGVTLQLNVTLPGRRNTVLSGELFGMRIRGYMRRGQPRAHTATPGRPVHSGCSRRVLDPDYQAPIRREGGPGREVDTAGDGAVPDEIGEGAGAPEELHRSGGDGRIVWAEGAVDLRQGVEGAAAVSAGVDAPYGKDELSVVRTLAVAGLARQHGVGEGSRSAERARRREGLQYRSAGP